MKGCPSEMVDNEVDSMLKNIGLNDKTETASKALSGGMKRKLCVGIALISGSKVHIRMLKILIAFNSNFIFEIMIRKIIFIEILQYSIFH